MSFLLLQDGTDKLLLQDGSALLLQEAAGGVTIAITGTATESITEADIVAGGKTIVITLTGDTWETFDDTIRQAIIDGIDSAQSEANGWDAEVKANQGTVGVVRTSDTVCTITLDAQAAYDITAQETITVTVPASALVTSADPIVASPTFTVDIVAAGILMQMMQHGHFIGGTLGHG